MKKEYVKIKTEKREMNKLYEGSNMKRIKKELAIELDIDCTVNMFYGVPLSILKTKREFKNWLYMNYMSPIFCVKKSDVDFYIVDGLRYGALNNIPSSLIFQSIVGEQILKYIDNIIPLIKTKIDEEWYSVIFLDNFFLDFSIFFKKEHFVHEILIYGYDDEKSIFQAVVYGKKMMKVEIKYDIFHEAYTSSFFYIKNRGDWKEYMLMNYKLNTQVGTYPYSGQFFLSNVEKYYEGKYSEKDYYEYVNNGRRDKFFFDREESYFGININDAIIEIIKNIPKTEDELLLYMAREDKGDNYMIFHVYSEFHKAFYNRLSYFLYNNSYYNVDVDLILKRYGEVVKCCEQSRIMFIKLKALAIKKSNKDVQNIKNRMIQIINWVRTEEKQILKDFLETYK